MKYYCDNKRHLVCKPYSIENLHKMAKKLKIKSWWFHKKKNGLNHYDIPKSKIKKITTRCNLVNSREIVNIIRKNEECK